MKLDIPIVVIHRPTPEYSNIPGPRLDWTARSLLPLPSFMMGDPFWQPAAAGETREEAVKHLRTTIERWSKEHRAELATFTVET
jgi:hypothetical protein